MIEQTRIFWTNHSERKMGYYRLSKQRVQRVLRNPDRKEYGIAPNTSAFMQKYGSKKHIKELWVMFQIIKYQKYKKVKIISAWRYPGISPKGIPPIDNEDMSILN